MLVQSQAVSPSSPKVQTCDFSCDTDVHAPAESPTFSAATFCHEVKCEAESSITPSTFARLLIHTTSSISPDPTAAVLFPLRGGVLSGQQPVRGAMRGLLAHWTLGAAAQRGAEARADRPSQQYEHDAVGCSLRGVANSM